MITPTTDADVFSSIEVPVGWANAHGEDHYNFLGIGSKKEEERYEDTLKDVKNWYELHDNITCNQIQINISKMETEMSKNEAALAGGASGGAERVAKRHNRAYAEHIANHEQKYIDMGCGKKKEEKETSEWINKTQDVLDNEETKVQADSQMNKYIIYGLAGIFGVVGIYFILK